MKREAARVNYALAMRRWRTQVNTTYRLTSWQMYFWALFLPAVLGLDALTVDPVVSDVEYRVDRLASNAKSDFDRFDSRFSARVQEEGVRHAGAIDSGRAIQLDSWRQLYGQLFRNNLYGDLAQIGAHRESMSADNAWINSVGLRRLARDVRNLILARKRAGKLTAEEAKRLIAPMREILQGR